MIQRSGIVDKIMTDTIPPCVETLRETLQQCGEMIQSATLDVTGERSEFTVHPRLWADISNRFGPRWKEISERSFELQGAASRKLDASVSSYSVSAKANFSTTTSQEKNNERFWWVTRRALEQATHARVALVKAGWFEGDTVHDLCCGIGGDALRFLERGAVHAVENDPLTAAMVSENLRLSGIEEQPFSIHCEDVEQYDLPPGSCLHLDPDRRVEGRAAVDPDHFSPSWQSVCRLIRRSSGALIKLAPATQVPHEPIDAGSTHRLWIETSGSVREQDLLWGDICDRANLKRGTRSAWVVQAEGGVEFFESRLSSDLRVASEVDLRRLDGAWLVDPRPAVRAAGLTEAFAAEHDCRFLAGPSGFLSLAAAQSEVPQRLSSLAVTGRVEWIAPFDDRKLRKELRRRDCFPQTIKVRGADHDPAQLVKRYRSCGEKPVRLWIGRIGKRVFAAITDVA